MTRIAVPSVNPGGLAARTSLHFGQCEAFTIVDLQDGQVAGWRVLANGDHSAGGCLAPVAGLKEAGVTALVASGMGPHPFAGLQEAGIEVYFDQEAGTVEEAVQLVAQSRAPRFAREQVCGGGQGDCGLH